MQRKMNVVVLGATGDVGRGIVTALLQAGHRVAAVARSAGRLDAVSNELANPAALISVPGSLASDSEASELLQILRSHMPAIDGVVVSVNARRQPAPLLTHSSTSFATLINQDLVTHYTAARCFAPALASGLASNGGQAPDPSHVVAVFAHTQQQGFTRIGRHPHQIRQHKLMRDPDLEAAGLFRG